MKDELYPLITNQEEETTEEGGTEEETGTEEGGTEE